MCKLVEIFHALIDSSGDLSAESDQVLFISHHSPTTYLQISKNLHLHSD